MRFVRNQNGERELNARQLPVSIPARRALALLATPMSPRELANVVRLGELEHHLQELLKHQLIEVVRADNTIPQPENQALPQAPAALIVAVKRAAIKFVVDHMPLGSTQLAFHIQSANTQEKLLTALSDAQRSLYDNCGKDMAKTYFSEIVEPLLGAL
jgi:hypothetical protein